MRLSTRSSRTSTPAKARWGTHVNAHHVAETAVDRRIVAAADVEFRVRAVDGSEEIGHGTHGRVVIDVAQFSAQLAGKVIDKPG
jgi:predicted thioesterase